MKHGAGFLKLACAWIVLALMHGLDAGRPVKKHGASVSCKPRELTTLTKSRIEDSLKKFDEANGKHLGTWPPGFPQLHVHKNSPVNWAEVQCSLIFMAQGLEEVLEDQKNNLNPKDVSLLKTLQDTFASIKMLTGCVKNVLKGDCSPEPPPPKMPNATFERKQWSHTLLKTSRAYLEWLQHKFEVKFMNKIKSRAAPRMYLEGSAHFL